MTKQDKKIRREARKLRAEHLTTKYYPVLILAVVAIALIIGGFFVPPMGVIDGSILTATGELIAIMGIFVFIARAESGSDIIFRKGDMEIMLDNDGCHHHHESDKDQRKELEDEQEEYEGGVTIPPPCRVPDGDE